MIPLRNCIRSRAEKERENVEELRVVIEAGLRREAKASTITDWARTCIVLVPSIASSFKTLIPSWRRTDSLGSFRWHALAFLNPCHSFALKLIRIVSIHHNGSDKKIHQQNWMKTFPSDIVGNQFSFVCRNECDVTRRAVGDFFCVWCFSSTMLLVKSLLRF